GVGVEVGHLGAGGGGVGNAVMNNGGGVSAERPTKTPATLKMRAFIFCSPRKGRGHISRGRSHHRDAPVGRTRLKAVLQTSTADQAIDTLCDRQLKSTFNAQGIQGTVT